MSLYVFIAFSVTEFLRPFIQTIRRSLAYLKVPQISGDRAQNFSCPLYTNRILFFAPIRFYGSML
jgi:hypothetical protein